MPIILLSLSVRVLGQAANVAGGWGQDLLEAIVRTLLVM